MPPVIAFIIIVGSAAILLILFLLRAYLAPRRIERVVRLIQEGKIRSAIRTARQLLDRDPRNADLHYLLGRALLRENKPQLALIEFRGVNQIGTFSDICPEGEFRHLAADLYEQFGQVEEALKERLLLAKLQPMEGDHYYRAGCLFEARSQPDIAATYYRKTLELDADHADAHYRLGLFFIRRNLRAEAKSEFEAAVLTKPENPRAWYYLGRLLKDHRDFGGALEAFEKAEHDPEMRVKALVERGDCRLQMNDLANAIMDLERALHLAHESKDPELIFARYYLAACYERTRRLDEAVAQWEKINATEPGFRDVGRKLNQYQSLRTDDLMKDYLTANDDSFELICRAVVKCLGMTVREVASCPNGCQVTAVENGAADHDSPPRPRLIRFLRESEDVPERAARGMYEEMKELNVHRSMIIASSNFSELAKEFAETRPIELIGRETLQKLLEQSRSQSP